MSNEEEEDDTLNASMIDEDGQIGGATAVIAEATMNLSADSSDDVLQTMQAKLVLRKNLDQDFHTVSEKIAHFESESKKNFLAAAAAAAAAATVTTSTATDGADSSILPASSVPAACPRFQVFLRIRPSTDDTSTIHILNSTTIQTIPPSSLYAALSKEYSYDAVLEPTLSQVQVYQRTAAPLVERLVQHDETVLLFCHGVTNAGKTFTIHGDGSSPSTGVAPEAAWGILPRIVHDTYHRLSSMPTKELQMTCFELYQERFYDLLPDNNSAATINNSMFQRKALRLREDKLNGLAFVEGLAKRHIESVAQALQWMKMAKKNRTTATNHLNQTSSRSHCVCQLIVTDTAHPDTPPATFWVVDLAGSERCKRTAGSGAMRHQEACSINKSLMTLMRCLMTLKDTTNAPTASTGTLGVAASATTTTTNSTNLKVPPFRESKLTHLLMPHWNEASRTVTAMIVNVNPSANDYEESQHVLSYATQAKTIQLTNHQTRAIQSHAAAAVPPKVEYDENGRRKRQGGMRAKVGQLLQKLSPKRVGAGIKRKAEVPKRTNDAVSNLSSNAQVHNKRLKTEPSSTVRPTTNGAATTGMLASSSRRTASKASVPPPATSIKSSKAYKALQMEMTALTAENTFLKGEKRELVEQLEHIEDRVRAEMAEEMEHQMDAMRNKYEAILQTYRQQKVTASAMKATPSRRHHREEHEVWEDKIAQLEDQVQECEEEMIRQREEHNRELEAIQLENERSLQEALQDNQHLRKELEQRQEMLHNYCKLLQDEEEEDEENDEDDVEEEDDDEEDEEIVDNDENEAEVPSEEEESECERVDDVEGLDSAPEDLRDDFISTDEQQLDPENVDESANTGVAEPSSDDDMSVHSEATVVASVVEVNSVHALIDLTQNDDSDICVENKAHEKEGGISVDTRTCDVLRDTVVNAGDEGSNKKVALADTYSLRILGEESVDENAVPVQAKSCVKEHNQKENDLVSSVPSRPFLDRKPLAVSSNKRESVSSSDNSDEESMWLPPKKPAKFDSKTGMYQRPKGRQPSGVESWDSKKGKWRLSTA